MFLIKISVAAIPKIKNNNSAITICLNLGASIVHEITNEELHL